MITEFANPPELTPPDSPVYRLTVCVERCALKSGGSTAVCLAIGATGKSADANEYR